MERKRFQPQEPYIKPKEIQLPEAWDIIHQGGKVPRGVVVTGFPEMPEVSVSRIKVTFLPTGEIRVPRYEEADEDAIKVQRFDNVKDPSAAIRRAWHQKASVSAEGRKLDGVYRRIQGLHEAIVDGWDGYNAAQRKAAADYAEAIVGSMTPRRGALTNRHKVKAVERLENAARLIGEDNLNAASLSLIGAANDLIARKNTLLRQEPLLERRGRSIAKRKFDEDRKFYEQLDGVIKVDSALTSPKPPEDADFERLAKSLEDTAQKTVVKDDKRLRRCAALDREAAKHLRAHDLHKAIPVVRLVRKTMVDYISESTVLYPERLKWVQNHRDTQLKRHIVRNQLKHFGENVEYWLSKARPEQVENMHTYLMNLTNALAGAGVPETQMKVKKAADLFQDEVKGGKDLFQKWDMSKVRERIDTILKEL